MLCFHMPINSVQVFTSYQHLSKRRYWVWFHLSAPDKQIYEYNLIYRIWCILFAIDWTINCTVQNSESIGTAVYKYGIYFLRVGSVDHKLILCKNRILLLTCTTELKIIHFFLFLEWGGCLKMTLTLIILSLYNKSHTLSFLSLGFSLHAFVCDLAGRC